VARLSDQDAMLTLLKRVGKSGASNKVSDPAIAPVVEELRRSISSLEQVCRFLLTHIRQGPEWGGWRQYHVRWNVVGANRQKKFAHGLGYVPDRMMVVLTSSETMGGAVTTWGGVALVSADENSVTFELDADAVTAKSSFLVQVWKEDLVQSAQWSSDQAGLSNKQAGYVDTSNMNG
jgi:hypothetical protein